MPKERVSTEPVRPKASNWSRVLTVSTGPLKRLRGRLRIGHFGLALALVASSLFTIAPIANGGDIVIKSVLMKVIEEVDIPALQEGPVTKIEVREGQQVRVGDTLVQIDEKRAQLKKTLAELEAAISKKKSENTSEIVLAQAELQVAEASLQRANDSRKKIPDTPSQAEVDEIMLRVAQARQHLEKAQQDRELAVLAHQSSEAQLAVAQFELEKHQIKSPIQGVIVEINARHGEWVKPGQGLVRVMRIDRLRVEGFIARDQAKAVSVGTSVTVLVEDDVTGKVKCTGKLVFVSPEVDANDNRQRFFAEIENVGNRLAPGTRASMLIHDK